MLVPSETPAVLGEPGSQAAGTDRVASPSEGANAPGHQREGTERAQANIADLLGRTFHVRKSTWWHSVCMHLMEYHLSVEVSSVFVF